MLIRGKDRLKTGTLDGQKSEKVTVENVPKRLIIEELYEQYTTWARKKQIEPVKQQSFTSWLRRNECPSARVTINDEPYMGKRKYVIYASWNTENDETEKKNQSRTAPQVSWEAYISQAPITFDLLPDLFGQIPPHARAKENNNDSHTHVYDLPKRVGQVSEISQKTNYSGSGENSPSCPTLNQNSEIPRREDNETQTDDIKESTGEPTNSDVSNEKLPSSETKGDKTELQDTVTDHENEVNKFPNLSFRKVVFDSPIVNPDPQKYPVAET